MFAFLRQTMDKRRKLLREAKPVENADMNISKEYLEVVRMSFQAKNLSEDKSSEKIKIIKATQDKMEILYHNVIDVQTDVKYNDIVILAVAFYNLGLIYVNSKSYYELRIAFTHFKTCLGLLEGKELDCQVILTYLAALNEINSVFYKIERDKYTHRFLKLAMEAYLAYTKKDNYSDPVYIPKMFDIKEKESNPRIILEALHFATLRELATQYSIQPKEMHGFVKYMHQILEIRLLEMVSVKREFREDCLNLALTLFDMSRYFLVNNRFDEARNYLVTADYVTYRFSKDTLETVKQINVPSDVSNSTSNDVSNITDDLSKLRHLYLSDSYDYVCGVSARSWGTYGVLLLRFWQERFVHFKSKICELHNVELEMESKEQSTNLLIFSDLKNKSKRVTDQITNTSILSLADAKSVFLKILKYLEAAQAYFTADTDIETYAKIILDVSAGYKYLAGFEHSRDEQIKLHKRRVEYLENVCKKFHTEIDIAKFQTYKRVWYEMVTSCSTVMDLILEEAYYNESKNMSKEVDRLAKLILGNIDLYLHVV